jgi:hypothetical protein
MTWSGLAVGKGRGERELERERERDRRWKIWKRDELEMERREKI